MPSRGDGRGCWLPLRVPKRVEIGMTKNGSAVQTVHAVDMALPVKGSGICARAVNSVLAMMAIQEGHMPHSD